MLTLSSDVGESFQALVNIRTPISTSIAAAITIAATEPCSRAGREVLAVKSSGCFAGTLTIQTSGFAPKNIFLVDPKNENRVADLGYQFVHREPVAVIAILARHQIIHRRYRHPAFEG